VSLTRDSRRAAEGAEARILPAGRQRPLGASSAAGGSESAFATRRFGQVVAFHPFDSFVAGNHYLGDAVARMDFEGFAAEVLQDDTDLTAIAGIDGGGTIRQRDRMLQGQSTAWPDLGLEARRELDGQTSRDQLRIARRERHGFDGVQVHTCVFVGPVGVARNDGVVAQFTNFQSV